MRPSPGFYHHTYVRWRRLTKLNWLLALAQENKSFTQSKFLEARDYLLVTTLHENASRLGPLEICVLARFRQATYSESTDRYTILVDKHKITRHQGPAELTITSRLYSYLQIYILNVWPQFGDPVEDALFVKVDRLAFCAGTIGKDVSGYFSQAGIQKDVLRPISARWSATGPTRCRRQKNA